MKRYSTDSIKHEALAKLRALRDEMKADLEAKERRRRALERAELCEATWDSYKTNVRPLRRAR